MTVVKQTPSNYLLKKIALFVWSKKTLFFQKRQHIFFFGKNSYCIRRIKSLLRRKKNTILIFWRTKKRKMQNKNTYAYPRVSLR